MVTNKDGQIYIASLHTESLFWHLKDSLPTQPSPIQTHSLTSPVSNSRATGLRLLDLLAVAAELQVLLGTHLVEPRHLGLVAVDDLGQLLERGAPRLDVHEVDEAELDEDPALCASRNQSVHMTQRTREGSGQREDEGGGDLQCR